MILEIENVLSIINELSHIDAETYETYCQEFEENQVELVDALSTLNETGLNEDLLSLAFDLTMVIDRAYQLQNNGTRVVVTAKLITEMVNLQIEDFAQNMADIDAWRDRLGADPERFLSYYIIETLMDQGWSISIPGGINMAVMLLAIIDTFDETIEI